MKNSEMFYCSDSESESSARIAPKVNHQRFHNPICLLACAPPPQHFVKSERQIQLEILVDRTQEKIIDSNILLLLEAY